MSGTGGILAGYESLRAGQEACYKDLRQHPELSHPERRHHGADQARSSSSGSRAAVSGE